MKLSDVLIPSDEKFDPKALPNQRFVGLADIESNTGRILGFGDSSKTRSTKSIFRKGDLLYGKLRPYLNKVWLATVDGVCSTDILVFKKNDFIDNGYLAKQLLTSDFVRFATQNMSGVQHPRVNYRALSSHMVKLPPLQEQHRISARIDELLSKLSEGVRYLERTRDKLEAYRGALLKSAFEGRLTEDWRKAPERKLESASQLLYQMKARNPPETAERMEVAAEIPELPPLWERATLEEIASKITDGEHIRPSFRDSGVYFLSAKDVREDGVTFERSSFVSESDAMRFRTRCDPQKGDILVVSRGATVGRCCIVNTEKMFCLLGSVILVKLKPILSSKFILYVLKSPAIQRKLIAASGSTAQQAIYIRDIRKLTIPFPPLLEQHRIVAEVERRLSLASELWKSVVLNLEHAEWLRRSVLKRAFEGKLVAQDPSDENAGVLLEAIATLKSTATSPKKIAEHTKASPQTQLM